MKLAMHLVLARFVDVRFPVDKDDIPDFTDSWASDVRDVGVTWLSASNVMATWRQKRQQDMSPVEDHWEHSHAASHSTLHEAGVYADPHTNDEFSTVLALAHPNDSFGVAIFRLISATPLLDLMTTYFFSGQPILWRNLWAGTYFTIKI